MRRVGHSALNRPMRTCIRAHPLSRCHKLRPNSRVIGELKLNTCRNAHQIILSYLSRTHTYISLRSLDVRTITFNLTLQIRLTGSNEEAVVGCETESTKPSSSGGLRTRRVYSVGYNRYVFLRQRGNWMVGFRRMGCVHAKLDEDLALMTVVGFWLPTCATRRQPSQ